MEQGNNGSKAVSELHEINKIIFRYSGEEENCQYSFYVYLDDKLLEKIPYSRDNMTIFWATTPGNYKAVIYVKRPSGEKEKFCTNSILYERDDKITNSGDIAHTSSVICNLRALLKENIEHFFMIFRLAVYDYQLESKDTYLGKIWNLLSPLIQIGTYWLVFGIGLRQGRDMGDIPYVIWMVCGLVPWFFMSQGITKGSMAIFSKANALARMKFPLSTLPLERILLELFEHIMMLFVLFFMSCCFGVYPTLYWLNLIYYILFMTVFLTCLSLITSVFTMFARDFSKLINSLIRLLFYITPILWDMKNMPLYYQKAMLFNPVYYAVKGFRDSLLYQTPFWQSADQMCFFWGLNLLLLLLGASLQMRFKNQFVDLL